MIHSFHRGQNKNNTMLMYLTWRVLMHFHTEVQLNFMIAGHTKFGPDWFFGIFKRRFRKTFVSSLYEIKQVPCLTPIERHTCTCVGRDSVLICCCIFISVRCGVVQAQSCAACGERRRDRSCDGVRLDQLLSQVLQEHTRNEEVSPVCRSLRCTRFVPS